MRGKCWISCERQLRNFRCKIDAERRASYYHILQMQRDSQQLRKQGAESFNVILDMAMQTK